MSHHHPHLIGREHRTPPGLGTGGARHVELPADLLREASRRLGIMALLGAVLWIVGSVLIHVALKLMFDDPLWLSFQMPDAVSVLSATVSLLLYLYTRKSTRSPEFILNVGIGFLIFTSIALGIVWHWRVDQTGPVEPTLTWIGVLVLMFAAIVPSPPRKTLLVGLVVVSMGPLGMAIAKARGIWNYGSDVNLFVMHYPDYLLVGVAMVVSHVVIKLGRQVTKARELGSYQIGELLGEGGMGQVYRATHRMLARPAAIKLIRPETIGGHDAAARELAVKRFHREAEVAASLRSPHTVALYDFGATDDDTLYFVMELLEGMNLETLVREHGPVPANRVISIMRQVCDSLEEAHARGLVHRDIKPANIHIGTLGLRHDFVKVLDFGLVKSIKGPTGAASHGGTAAGMTPGTPDYMAPEMTMGEYVDARADLYALGCVAYYLLTGKPVFEAANVFHMIARHLNDTPAPPSQRGGIALPPELERVVLSCLEKQPDRRPQSAAMLRQALCEIDVERWGEAQAAAWWSALPL